MNEPLLLFTDGSVCPKTKRGYGAALLLTPQDCLRPTDELNAQIKTHRFTETSSTKVELQTLLWALEQVPSSCSTLTVYTDSQNILSLPIRRTRLEAKNYRSQKGQPLSNASIYQSFFLMSDRLAFKLVKIKGHKASAQSDSMDRIFKRVDKAARKACRIDATTPSPQ